MCPLGEAFRRAMDGQGDEGPRRPPARVRGDVAAAKAAQARARPAAGPAAPLAPPAPPAPGEAEGAHRPAEQVYSPVTAKARPSSGTIRVLAPGTAATGELRAKPPSGADAWRFLSHATRVATFAEGPLPPGCDVLAGLRAALFSLGLDRMPSTILVAGAGCGEATTVLAAGLAGEFARDLAHHVLLLDASVRRPRVSALLELEPELDLADVLEARAEPGEAIVYSEGDNLSALVLRPDPLLGASRASAEALLGARGQDVLLGLQEAFDYVVVDGGAVEESAAPRVLAGRASGTVLVFPKGVGREAAREAKRAIESGGGRVLGAVLCV